MPPRTISQLLTSSPPSRWPIHLCLPGLSSGSAALGCPAARLSLIRPDHLAFLLLLVSRNELRSLYIPAFRLPQIPTLCPPQIPTLCPPHHQEHRPILRIHKEARYCLKHPSQEWPSINELVGEFRTRDHAWSLLGNGTVIAEED